MTILLALGGCDREEEAQADPPQEAEETVAAQADETADPDVVRFPRNDWECTEESRDELARWWEAWHMDDVRVDVGSITLAAGEPDPEARPGDLATLLVDEDTDLETTLAQALEQRRAEQELLDEVDEDEAIRVTLAIDAQTSTEHVGELLEQLRAAEVDTAVFVVGREATELPYEPVPDEVQQRVEQVITDDDLSGTARMAATRDALQECPELRELLDGMEQLPPDQRSAALREGLPAGWYACDCDADIEWVVGLFTLRAASGEPAGFVELTLDELQERLDGAPETWGELVATF